MAAEGAGGPATLAPFALLVQPRRPQGLTG
jgi:hypothetical protein